MRRKDRQVSLTSDNIVRPANSEGIFRVLYDDSCDSYQTGAFRSIDRDFGTMEVSLHQLQVHILPIWAARIIRDTGERFNAEHLSHVLQPQLIQGQEIGILYLMPVADSA